MQRTATRQRKRRKRYLQSVLKAVIPARYVLALKLAYFLVRSPFYIGDRVTCPCCGRHYRQFVTTGVGRARENAQCPGCGAWERHRLLWLYFRDRTNLFSDRLKVLHVAPEYVFQRAFVAMPNLDYVSADLMSPLAQIKFDITHVPYAHNAFDVVLCNHVLEHVPEDRQAMREVCRVLRPDGWAILEVPIKREKTFEDPTVVTPKDRERVFGQSDHVRIYGRDYKDRLEAAGFEVRVDRYAHELGPEAIREYGLMESEDIYFCVKSESIVTGASAASQIPEPVGTAAVARTH